MNNFDIITDIFVQKKACQANLLLSIHLRGNVKLVFGELAYLNFIN